MSTGPTEPRDMLPNATSGGGNSLTRRDALRLLAAQMTLSLAACGRPAEEIVPYVEMPERVVPGDPMRFATVLPLSGYGRGVLVSAVDGRPIKVEGNPRHPSSLGSTDVFAEAAVLSLYEPDRSRTVLRNADIASWETFMRAFVPERGLMQSSGGEGLRILTGRVTSPTLARQMDNLLKQYPKAVWHAYDPALEDTARTGAELAFGRPLSALPHLDRAEVILSLGADPLGPGPEQIRNGRAYASRRTPGRDALSRIYAVDAAPTLTSAKADNRIGLSPAQIGEAAVAVAHALGAGLRSADLPEHARAFVQAAVQDLQGKRGRALVLAGPMLPPEIQALVHWINARLEAPVDLIEPVDRIGAREPASLAGLVRALDSETVRMLVVLDANPVYDAPADFDFAQAMKKARFRVHAGIQANETAAVSTWHLPVSHPLESWSDLRATDGTASIMQPLIRPLYATRTIHEITALLTGQEEASYDLVRQTWASQAGEDFERWWLKALHDGVVPDSAAAPVSVGAPQLPSIGPAVAAGAGLTVLLRPDPCVWDGSFANNAWLQELPKPLTKQVWGNALSLGKADAARFGLQEGDMVRLMAGERELKVPVSIEPGHAVGVASLTLGYGRTRAGAIGNGVGANAYEVRTSQAPWILSSATLEKADGHQDILRPQNIVRSPEDIDSEAIEKLFPVLSLPALAEGKKPDLGTGPLPSLYPQRPVPPAEHAWAMVIDTALCIGCNACVVACQAENNIPVVGPEEVERGRDMHWLRIDVYDHGTPEHPKPGFQPVPCMHCEKAPCEPVCPVAASVHDGEGLNLQIYNRCVGTRFCEANCPYKVRRFNFFAYADGQEYANLGEESYKAQKNPEVTVRTRGVMEKCTYCVQRISAARRAAEREGRPVRTDEVVTACQSACPTQTIIFGDLFQEDSAVNRLKRDERHYVLRGELGTRPRTTYLADIRNPNPGLDGDDA